MGLTFFWSDALTICDDISLLVVKRWNVLTVHCFGQNCLPNEFKDIKDIFSSSMLVAVHWLVGALYKRHINFTAYEK